MTLDGGNILFEEEMLFDAQNEAIVSTLLELLDLQLNLAHQFLTQNNQTSTADQGAIFSLMLISNALWQTTRGVLSAATGERYIWPVIQNFHKHRHKVAEQTGETIQDVMQLQQTVQLIDRIVNASRDPRSYFDQTDGIAPPWPREFARLVCQHAETLCGLATLSKAEIKHKMKLQKQTDQ